MVLATLEERYHNRRLARSTERMMDVSQFVSPLSSALLRGQQNRVGSYRLCLQNNTCCYISSIFIDHFVLNIYIITNTDVNNMFRNAFMLNGEHKQVYVWPIGSLDSFVILSLTRFFFLSIELP